MIVEQSSNELLHVSCLPVLDKFTAVTGAAATAGDRGCASTIFCGFVAAADKLIAWL